MTGAQACAALRPGWDGTPATALSEAAGLLLSPGGLFLSAALGVAVVFRHAAGTLIAVLLWSAFAAWLALPDAAGLQALARAEGCIAAPSLFIALSAAICVLAVFYTLRRDTRH